MQAVAIYGPPPTVAVNAGNKTPLRIGLAALTVGLAAGGVATAQAALPSDPSADSPAGVIYQIPLDTARWDAAPRRRARGGVGNAPSRGGERGGEPRGGGGGVAPPPGAGPGVSPIRSENNFGSSSTVPGIPVGSAGAGRGAAETASRTHATGAGRPDDASDRRRSGSGAQPSAAGSSSPLAGDDDGPSPGLAIALLAVTALVGVGAGTAATRARGRG